VFGLNSRLDELQAAILNVKLNYLEDWNQRRTAISRVYDESFLNKSYITPLKFEPNVSSVYHLYLIKVNDRDDLQRHLANCGIQTLIHYPVPCHLQQAYKYLGYREGDLPVSEANAKKILSLPIFPQMTEDEVHSVINSIIGYYES